MSDNNVVSFPGSRKVIRTESGLPQKTEEEADAFAVSIASFAANEILEVLHEDGLERKPTEYYQDMAFVLEAVRSMVLRFYAMEHPIQDLAENTIKVTVVDGNIMTEINEDILIDREEVAKNDDNSGS